jgi:LuxR family maltose regulon positive regulatory protein
MTRFLVGAPFPSVAARANVGAMTGSAPDATSVPPPRLRSPRLPSDLVSRPRLLRRLDETGGVTCVLAAPAGFGKTTLLAHWAGRTPAGAVAWLTLDESERNPAVFRTHLTAALARSALTLAEGPAAASALVLDGYEQIAGSAGEDELWRFVAERPAVQLVVAGRGEPSAPLAAARAHGEVLELRASELRFDRSEAFELVGRAAGTEGWAPAEIVDACAGWPAALRLALTAPSPQVWEGRLLDFVTEDVVRPRDARAFLLRASLLDELSARACDGVFEAEDSAAVLADLERRHFLVERGGRDGLYRIEPAARRVLAAELESTQGRFAGKLHRRAAAAELAAGRKEQAVEHFLACGDTAAAGRIVSAIWGRVTDRGGRERVLEWLDRLPPGPNDLRLALARGWLLRLDGRLAESERWLDLARTLAPLELRPAVVRACVLARAALPWDDVGRARTLARRAWRSERHGPRRALAAWALGWAYWWGGDLVAAAKALELAFGGPRLVEATALAVLSRIDLEHGDVDAADARVTAAELLVAEWGLESLPELGMVATARGAVAAARGSGAVALPALERGIRARRLWGHPLETADALAVAAPLVASERGRREAGVLLAEARLLLGACADPGAVPERLAAAARVALPRPSAGNYDELTPRERTVLRLLAEGRSKREIAAELLVSFNTVHSHTKAVYRKLGVSTRREAVERASVIMPR